jgi:hypothetical protein
VIAHPVFMNIVDVLASAEKNKKNVLSTNC